MGIRYETFLYNKVLQCTHYLLNQLFVSNDNISCIAILRSLTSLGSKSALLLKYFSQSFYEELVSIGKIRDDFFETSIIWWDEKYHLNMFLYFFIESISVRRFCSCSSWCTLNGFKFDRAIFHLVFLFFRFWILLIIEATLTRGIISHYNIEYLRCLLIFLNLTWRSTQFVIVCFHMIFLLNY